MKKLLLLLSVLLQPLPVAAMNSEAAFGGVGIDGIRLADGNIRVGQMVSGGPAHMAGIRVGDVITRIDGTETARGNFQTLVQKRLRGRAGSPVTIRVRRPGEREPLTFRLTRRQLLVQPAKEKK